MNAPRKVVANAEKKPLADTLDERSTARMHFRTKPHVKHAIQRAAAWSGLDDSSFVINAAYNAALETIAAHERMVVSQRDFDRMLDAIDNPPEPTDALREAFERHKRTVVSK